MKICNANIWPVRTWTINEKTIFQLDKTWATEPEIIVANLKIKSTNELIPQAKLESDMA